MAQLCGAVGVSAQMLQKYETGVSRVAASRISALATALRVAPAYFFQSASLDLEAEMREDWCRMGQAFARIRSEDLRAAILTMVDAIGDK